jgi:hypothetical protein
MVCSCLSSIIFQLCFYLVQYYYFFNFHAVRVFNIRTLSAVNQIIYHIVTRVSPTGESPHRNPTLWSPHTGIPTWETPHINPYSEILAKESSQKSSIGISLTGIPTRESPRWNLHPGVPAQQESPLGIPCTGIPTRDSLHRNPHLIAGIARA